MAKSNIIFLREFILEFFYFFQELFPFKDRSPREIAVIDAVENERDDGYVVCYTKGDMVTLKHEMAHFFYATNKMYQSLALRNVKSMPKGLYKRY